MWPPGQPRDDKLPGWSGGRKWNYSKRSGGDTRPERRSKGWRESMRCTGEWCARRLKAPSRRSERSTRGNGRSWIPVKDAIDRMLVSDRQAPRKQHHTAHRIWTRLHEEHPSHPIAEPTVRRYVQRRKQELGLSSREVFAIG